MLRFQSSSEVSSNAAAEAMPALATRMSRPAKSEQRLVERGFDFGLVRHINVNAAHDILAELFAEVSDGGVQALGVDVGEHDACPLAHEPSRDRLPDAARAAGHQRDAAGERFRLRHALKLGLFQQPIFDIERFLLRKPHVLADARRATHHVDRIDVKFRGDASGRFVLGEGQHADAGNEIDDRVRVAHRWRVRMFAALDNRRCNPRGIRRASRPVTRSPRRDCALSGRKAARAGGSSCAGSDPGTMSQAPPTA